MTPAGFPHSEIHGSKPGRRLPVAYRSHPRPSSASGAKASTVGSFLLGSFFLPCLLDARARSAVLKGRAGRSRQVRAVVPAGRRRLSTEELAGVEEAGAPSQRNSERRATRAPVVPSNASSRNLTRGKETGSEVIRIAE